MKVKFLLARMDKAGRWQKVRVFAPSVAEHGGASGWHFSHAMAGSLDAAIAKQAARFFAAEKAAAEIFYDVYGSQYRATRL